MPAGGEILVDGKFAKVKVARTMRVTIMLTPLEDLVDSGSRKIIEV